MEVTGQILNLAPFIEIKEEPEIVLKLVQGQQWRVLASHITDPKPEWRLVRLGELVRIPLRPYRAQSELASDVALMLISTASAIAGAHRDVIQQHWVLGDPETDYEDGASRRLWIGYAGRIL